MSGLSPLGVGLVWWPSLDPLCRESEGLVKVIEAEPEAFWIPEASVEGMPGFRSCLFEALSGLSQPKLLHGVGAPLGGTCSPVPDHIETFAQDVDRLHPEWVSEHLSFSRFAPTDHSRNSNPTFAGFLLPPLQSYRAVEIAAENIRRRRVVLRGAAIAFETGVSYLPPRPEEIPDGEFAAAVAEAADCGILLDLHNLFCNERNGRQSVAEFCASLPLERVWEIHLAGGEDYRGFRLDAHSGLVEPALMETVAKLVGCLPNLRAIIFEIMPDFVSRVGLCAIGRQLEVLNEVWDRRSSLVRACQQHRSPFSNTSSHVRAESWEPNEWEALLGSAVTGLASRVPENLAGWWSNARPAVDLYRHLASEGRASMLVATAGRTVRLLLRHYGSTTTRSLLSRFLLESPPAYTAVDEGRAFLQFVGRSEVTVPGVKQAVADDEDMLATITRREFL
jgi:uncharacterized protein (UPF0276 family)